MTFKYKPAILFIGLFFFICATAPVSSAVSIPAQPGTPVVDLAGIVDQSVAMKLNAYLRELEQKTTAQVAVLTINSLDGESIEDLAITIAHDKWKLGQKEKDNGALLLIAVKERKYRIEVGYGLEGLLPDSLVGSIGRNYLEPFFKQGKYSQGVFAATVALANEIAKDAGVEITGMPQYNRTAQKRTGPLGNIISLIIFIIILILFIKNPRLFFALFLLSSMSGRGSSWGGGSRGFGGGLGGFGGGGGGFGGGGASGGW
jgi:uncharacterized protein